MSSIFYEKDFDSFPEFFGKTFLEKATMLLFSSMPEDFPVKIQSKEIIAMEIYFTIEDYCAVKWILSNDTISIIGAYDIGSPNDKSRALFEDLKRLGFVTPKNELDVLDMIFYNRRNAYLKRPPLP